MMDKSTGIRTGRCWNCGGGVRPRVAHIYQWTYKKGLELWKSFCPRCGEKLHQTTASNLKHYVLHEETPLFAENFYDGEKAFREHKQRRQANGC